jgi:hypothetical protein
MKALLLIDIQNGFCPGGNLAVPDGDKVVPIANRLIESGRYDLIVASQDWHPEGHGSFASSHPGKQPFELGTCLSGKPQMMWPDHCVQGTKDAELHPDSKFGRHRPDPQKGENHHVDSYSAFRDNDRDAINRPLRFPPGSGGHRARPLRSGDRLLRQVLGAGCTGDAARHQGPLHRGCQPRHHAGGCRRSDRRNARQRHRYHHQRRGACSTDQSVASRCS